MHAFPRLALSIVLAVASTLALAQENSHAGHGSHGAHAGQATPAPVELTDGEVRKIDQEALKITMRHGELKNLGMPAMTMVLRVKDAAMLAQLQVGDKVRFAADRVDGALIIVQLQKAQ